MIAYAIAGTIRFDIERDVLGHDADGTPVMLKDIWPGDADIDALVRRSVHRSNSVVCTCRCCKRLDSGVNASRRCTHGTPRVRTSVGPLIGKAS